MKKFIALVSITLLGLTEPTLAQMPMGPGAGRMGGQMPTGHFYGRVVDPSNKGVEAASVTLVTSRMDTGTKAMKEVVVGGMLTDRNGNFSIDNVPLMGKYQIKISGIGFLTIQKPVAFEMPNRNSMAGGDMTAMIGAIDRDLGNIKVEVDEKTLGNVTITASRPTLSMGIDRKIFNVDKNIATAGGTAVDVMRNVPSINVDIDGNVSLRNASPTIFVDGRPTTMTLEQIPADAIESVEIITNPSAKFDASGGTAGILNIVMKKNRRVGYSGNVRADIDSRARVGFGGDINMRQNKINVFASGMLMQRRSIATGFTERTSKTLTDTSYYSTQRDRNISEGQFGFGRFGVDYFMDIRNTLTVTANFVRGGFTPEAVGNIFIDTLKGGAFRNQEYQRRTT
ncbi:MAG TPA: TonB-dependent receptor, partial [Flavisolibacter sp.]|nr:TonB-dependent receptor [Flavisolibacter sp.]